MFQLQNNWFNNSWNGLPLIRIIKLQRTIIMICLLLIREQWLLRKPMLFYPWTLKIIDFVIPIPRSAVKLDFFLRWLLKFAGMFLEYWKYSRSLLGKLYCGTFYSIAFYNDTNYRKRYKISVFLLTSTKINSYSLLLY